MSEPIATGDGGAGWYGLLGLIQSGRETWRAFREMTPLGCPLCGGELRSGPNGELFCRFEGWQWDGSVEDAQPRNH